MSTLPKIYIASKVDHHLRWNELREREAHRVTIISQWHRDFAQNAKEEEYMRPEFMKEMWIRNTSDCAAAHWILVIQKGQDQLRGAIFEAAYGLAWGARVVYVGDDRNGGSWIFTPGIYRKASISEALDFICAFSEDQVIAE